MFVSWSKPHLTSQCVTLLEGDSVFQSLQCLSSHFQFLNEHKNVLTKLLGYRNIFATFKHFSKLNSSSLFLYER